MITGPDVVGVANGRLLGTAPTTPHLSSHMYVSLDVSAIQLYLVSMVIPRGCTYLLATVGLRGVDGHLHR